MTIRLNKVTRDLNVGISTVVEFLQKKGFAIEANPNTKITEEQYAILVKEFSKDKNLRIESEKFIQERQNKDRNKASIAIEGYDDKSRKEKKKTAEVIKTVIPEDARPKFKQVGKIDLDNLGKKPRKEADAVKDDNSYRDTFSDKETIANLEAATVKDIITDKETVPQEIIVLDKEVITDKEPVNEVLASNKAIIVDKDKALIDNQTSSSEEKIEQKISEEIKQKVEPASLQNQLVGKEPSNEKNKEGETVEIRLDDTKGFSNKGRVAKVEEEMKSQTETVVNNVGNPEKEIWREEPAVEYISSTPETQNNEEVSEKVEKQEEESVTNEVSQVEESGEEVFKIRSTEFVSKINVVGQIDLNALNQSTRPKKKTKEEKRKEREEKEKLRQEQKKQMKDAIIKEIRKVDENVVKKAAKVGDKPAEEGKKKKKRSRINKERVDINTVSGVSPAIARPIPNSEKASFGKNRSSNQNRYKKPIIKAEVSDEDVAKQVKETLARLTTKGKNKGSKYRKEKREMASNRQMELENQEKAESRILKLTEFVTANELASMMDVSVNQVIATCMSVGIMVSINQRLDAETINLVADEFGYKTEYVSAEVAQAIVEEDDDPADLQPRAPIVTVMGHVDHGKTSLLDYIRKANVIAGEAGGITQHIGAYNVTLEDGRHITFLDTPGHEAFTAMRARGAKVTDIAIIIVAADDNVMPQTKEAINHATAAGVPIVFAINKVDKPTANPDKIKEELANMNFLVEEWGGKYQSQDISAKKGSGVSELMEKVLLEAEMLDLKANPNRHATGSIIESTLDKGRGYVATVLVSNGTLRMGDIVLAGTNYGRIKAMFNERNQRIKEAGPSEPVLILGLNGAPTAGDSFHVIETEQEAREIANKREQLQREQGLRTQKLLTLDEVGRRIALGNFQELNIIVKGDVDGSIEALSDSLIKLSTPQIQVNVIHKAVGQISESDVTLAAASDAIIIGFQVRPSVSARKFAEQEGVDIRMYSVIYSAIEEVKAAMEGMLAPELKEEVTATIEVREVFHITKVGTVAGAMVKEGKVKRTDKARLIRDGIVIYTGEINALKRFKDDVKEVAVNYECGISLTNYNDIQIGDIIESYQEVEVKATL